MRVIWDAGANFYHASTRIRNTSIRAELANAGVQFVEPNEPADVAIHFKRVRPGRYASNHVLDLSDNHFWLGPDAPAEAQETRRQLIADTRWADQVVCATPLLAAAAAPYRRCPPIVIPDPIDPLLPTDPRRPVTNRLLWFGNWGSKHHPEAGGMQDLLIPDVLDALDAFWGHLVVCSNSFERYRALDEKLPIPTRYVEWSPEAITSLLSSADLAIIPVQLTPYTSAKSHNRVTTCIAAGVPVVSSWHPAYEEFGVCTNTWTEVLDTPLPAPRPKSLLAPYHVEVIAKLWLKLLAAL